MGGKAQTRLDNDQNCEHMMALGSHHNSSPFPCWQTHPISCSGQQHAPGKPYKQEAKAAAVLHCCSPQQLVLGDTPPLDTEILASHHS